jgi:hypothetical protein
MSVSSNACRSTKKGDSMPDSTDIREARAPLGGPSRGGKVTRGALIATVILVAALMGLAVQVINGASVGVVPLLVGLVLAALPLPVYLALALWLDRYEKEPVWMLVGAFFWGATVAIFLAIVLEMVGTPILDDVVGDSSRELSPPRL